MFRHILFFILLFVIILFCFVFWTTQTHLFSSCDRATEQTHHKSSYFLHAAQPVGSQFPDEGSYPCLLQWKHRDLTTGPPGKSPEALLKHRFILVPIYFPTIQKASSHLRGKDLESFIILTKTRLQFYLHEQVYSNFLLHESYITKKKQKKKKERKNKLKLPCFFFLALPVFKKIIILNSQTLAVSSNSIVI